MSDSIPVNDATITALRANKLVDIVIGTETATFNGELFNDRHLDQLVRVGHLNAYCTAGVEHQLTYHSNDRRDYP